jgi:hypothetical protein
MTSNKEQRIQELSLIIHNCRVFGVKVKQELLDELNELTKE